MRSSIICSDPPPPIRGFPHSGLFPDGLGAHGNVEEVPIPSLHCAAGLLRYWNAKKPPNGLPDRDAIRPREIASLLPGLLIAERISSDWRYRLVGTDLCVRYGADPTWKTTTEIFDEEAASVRALYDAVIENGEAIIMRLQLTVDGREIVAETVHLPLSAKHGRAPQVLGGAYFSHRPPRRLPF